MQEQADDKLNTRQVATRLGLSPSELSELRLKTDALPIEQDGLSLFYRMDAVKDFERQETLKVMERVLQGVTPLVMLRTMASVSGLSKLYIAGQLVTEAKHAPAANQEPTNNPQVSTALGAVQRIKPALESSSQKSQSPTPVPTTDLMRKGPELEPLSEVEIWYLVHTKPKQELVAVENLQRQGYSCYLPTLKQQKIQRTQLKVVSEPMFPRYVFVAGDSHFQTKGASVIRSTIGVHEMVHFGNRPAVIQFGLLKAIHERQRVQQHSPSPVFQPGEKVRITSGPLAGLESIYQTQSGEERSMILLNLLSRPTKLQVATTQLAKMA